MNPTEIEFAVRDLVAGPYDAATFPYDLIAIYNASAMTVARLESGTTNKAEHPGDVLWQKKLFFRPAALGEDVGSVADALAADPLTARHKPRFIMVTNGRQVHARDCTLGETANVEFERLDEQAYFLLPIAGYERRAIVEEHPADIKAAKKLKKLYDALLAANPTWNTGHHAHELNLLMTRLLFCLYAEDTAIFETPQIFTRTLTQQTSEDGAEVAPLLDRIFRAMNFADAERSADMPPTERRFPYVNGSLFENPVEIPKFSRTARRQLIECGDLDWTTINPDIFGSMIQTVAQDGTRSDLGMHYTSVPNIKKALQPLFLDELEAAFERVKDSVPKLEALVGRLAKIRVFDPACGSGNFLIIAYKALRDLETRILLRIGLIAPNAPLRLSGVSLHNFYGIDVVDFACETTKLSLWIAEHQSNIAFREIFGVARPTLPLAKIDSIHCGNAVRLNWLDVCPRENGAETYVCGNPPYAGAKTQSPTQRADVKSIFDSLLDGDSNIDYVACWFVKLSDYLAHAAGSSGALVATNSICQGEQVSFLWPYVFEKGLCISFAHTSFKWENSASNNAGVICVIVGLAKPSEKPRRLFGDGYQSIPTSINAYLAPGPQDVVVRSSAKPLNGFPEAVAGSQPKDGGNLMLTVQERDRILAANPDAAAIIRRFYSAEDMLHSIERYTLWIDDEHLAFARSIPAVVARLDKVRADRSNGGMDKKRVAGMPHRYARNAHKMKDALVIPSVSSERRPYLQAALVGPEDIVGHTLVVVYEPPLHLFALVSSRMHRIWAQTVGGRLKSDLRYSSNVVYNTFPVPDLSDAQRRSLADHARNVLRTRARHIGITLADLYNPETMPTDLLSAHQENDENVEKSIYGRAFTDDAQRLERLFTMYAGERDRQARDGLLFATEIIA